MEARLIFDENDCIGGAIYFISDSQGDCPFCGDNIRVKIGYASNPVARLKELQTGNANRLRLAYGFPARQEAEWYVHRLFSKSKAFREWYFVDHEFHNAFHLVQFITSAMAEAAKSVCDDHLRDCITKRIKWLCNDVETNRLKGS